MNTIRRFRLARWLVVTTGAVALAAPMAAQRPTLTRGTPEEVGMSPAVLEAGVLMTCAGWPMVSENIFSSTLRSRVESPIRTTLT